VTREQRRSINSQSERFRSDLVVDRQDRHLVERMLRGVSLPRRFRRNETSSFGEPELRVATFVGVHHVPVARERAGGAEFLGVVIQIGDRATFRRFN